MANRRSFLKQSGSMIGGTLLLSGITSKNLSAYGLPAPSDQVNIGAIGINGMGWANTLAAMKVPGVNVVALCDIDKNVLNKRMAELAKSNVDISKIKTY